MLHDLHLYNDINQMHFDVNNACLKSKPYNKWYMNSCFCLLSIKIGIDGCKVTFHSSCHYLINMIFFLILLANNTDHAKFFSDNTYISYLLLLHVILLKRCFSSNSTDHWSIWCMDLWLSWSLWDGHTSLSSCLTASSSTAWRSWRKSGSALWLDLPAWQLLRWSPLTPGRWDTGI